MANPRGIVAAIKANNWTVPTSKTGKTGKTETDMFIGPTRGSIKMIASTIVIPHIKTEGTMIAIAMTNLVVQMSEGTPRPQSKTRIIRVAVMLTMWR